MIKIVPASDLSDSERCYRFVQIKRKFEPNRLPVREGAKRRFAQGLRDIYAGCPVETAEEAFLEEAAVRGFEYPGDVNLPYTAAKYYASWIDGAVRIAQEMAGPLTPMEPRNVAGLQVDPEGYYDANRGLHFFRVTSSFSPYTIHWPEMIAMLTDNAREATVHRLHLPSLIVGRIPSPLCLCYSHPMTGVKRLARLMEEDERKFKRQWVRTGRWELPEIDWPEWRLGIDRDQCMNLIYDKAVVDEKQIPLNTLMDAGKVLKSIPDLAAAPAVKKHEVCSDCMYKLFCHGGRGDRQEKFIALYR
jgi:hypothetical protein